MEIADNVFIEVLKSELLDEVLPVLEKYESSLCYFLNKQPDQSVFPITKNRMDEYTKCVNKGINLLRNLKEKDALNQVSGHDFTTLKKAYALAEIQIENFSSWEEDVKIPRIQLETWWDAYI